MTSLKSRYFNAIFGACKLPYAPVTTGTGTYTEEAAADWGKAGPARIRFLALDSLPYIVSGCRSSRSRCSCIRQGIDFMFSASADR